MPFVVRPARRGDLDAMVRMRLRLQEHLCRVNPSVWPLRDGGTERRRVYDGWIEQPDARLALVGEVGGGPPVGMAVGTVQTHPTLGPGRSGYIDDVWVEPEHRGRGAATALVGDLLAFFEERGLSEVGLGWAVGNEVAESFWRRWGFEPVIVTASAPLPRLLDRS